jgi:osmotically-inducible protein OsmY
LDSDIFAAARKALDDDPRVTQDVRVHVDSGTVTLTGTVRAAHERLHAEAITRQVDGVRAVINRITVAQIVSADGFDAPQSQS